MKFRKCFAFPCLSIQEKPLAYWRMTDSIGSRKKSRPTDQSFWEFLTSKRALSFHACRMMILCSSHCTLRSPELHPHTFNSFANFFLCLACRDRWLGVPMARNFSAAYTAKTAKKHSNTRKCRTSSEFEQEGGLKLSQFEYEWISCFSFCDVRMATRCVAYLWLGQPKWLVPLKMGTICIAA